MGQQKDEGALRPGHGACLPPCDGHATGRALPAARCAQGLHPLLRYRRNWGVLPSTPNKTAERKRGPSGLVPVSGQQAACLAPSPSGSAPCASWPLVCARGTVPGRKVYTGRSRAKSVRGRDPSVTENAHGVTFDGWRRFMRALRAGGGPATPNGHPYASLHVR